jgi:hypothetical protein
LSMQKVEDAATAWRQRGRDLGAVATSPQQAPPATGAAAAEG